MLFVNSCDCHFCLFFVAFRRARKRNGRIPKLGHGARLLPGSVAVWGVSRAEVRDDEAGAPGVLR